MYDPVYDPGRLFKTHGYLHWLRVLHGVLVYEAAVTIVGMNALVYDMFPLAPSELRSLWR